MPKRPFLTRWLVVLCLVATMLTPAARAAPLGQTWAPPVNVSNSPTVSSTKPSMGLDDSGTLHLVWVEGTAPNTQIRYAAKPVGQAWSGSIPLSETTRSDNPRLFVDAQSVVHVVWQGDGNANKGDIYYRQIRNNLPSAIQKITDNASDSTFPDIAVDANGVIHVVFLDDSSGIPNVFYVSKRFQDPSPGPIPVGSTPTLPAALPRATVDSQGTVHIVWVQAPSSGLLNDIFYVNRPVNQPNFTPQPPLNASQTTSNSTSPAIVADNADTLHLIWVETVGSAQHIYYSRKASNEFTWRTPLDVSAGSPNNAFTPALDVDSSRTVHIAFSEDLGGGNTDIFYTAKPDTSASFTMPVPVITNNTPSQFPALAVRQAVHIAWQDGAPPAEEIMYTSYLLPQPAGASVLLEQIEADSPSQGDNREFQWVQLYNNSPTDVVLDNWSICSNAGCTTVPKVGGAAVTLKGISATTGVLTGQSVIVAANGDRFRTEHPTFTGLVLSQGGFIANGMNATADTIQLRNAQGVVVDQVTWGTGGVQPPPTRTRDTLQRNLQTNTWFVGPEAPVSTASTTVVPAAPGNALYVPLALKAYQSWDTGIQVQNLSAQPSSLYVTYYTQQGTIAYSEPLATLAAAAAKTYYLPAATGLAGNFFGAAVITSTTAIAGIVNLTNYAYAGNKSATTSYNAISNVATTVGLPLVRRDANYTTQFVVQNTTANATTFRITYYDQNGLNVGQSDGSLVGWGSALVDTSASLTRNGLFSAIVTSQAPIAVAALALNTTGSTAISYQGVALASQTVSAPLLFKNRNGYTSGISIQNMGTAAATISISYLGDTGVPLPAAAETVVLQPNGYYRTELTARAGIPDNWVGSATITIPSGQALAVVVEQTNVQLNQATSYNGIDASGAALTLYAPLLMKANNGWDTGLQLQNVGASAASVTVTYYSRDTFQPVSTATGVIQPNAPYTFFTPDAPNLPAGFVGSAVVQSTSGQRLVGVVNQVNYKIGNGGDTSMTYSLVGAAQ